MRRLSGVRVAGLAALISMTACAANSASPPVPGNTVREVYAGNHCAVPALGVGPHWLSSPAEAAAWQDRQRPRFLAEDSTGPHAAGLEAVDFSRERVLIIPMGRQPTAGYRLVLAKDGPWRVDVDAGVARLSLHWLTPPPALRQAQVVTQPCLAVALPRGGYERVEVLDQNGVARFTIASPASATTPD